MPNSLIRATLTFTNLSSLQHSLPYSSHCERWSIKTFIIMFITSSSLKSWTCMQKLLRDWSYHDVYIETARSFTNDPAWTYSIDIKLAHSTNKELIIIRIISLSQLLSWHPRELLIPQIVECFILFCNFEKLLCEIWV